MKLYIVTMIFVLSLSACSQESDAEKVVSRMPGEEFELDQGQILALEKRAVRGDLSAAHMLSQHYTLATSDRHMAIRWLRVSAESGDVMAMLNLSAMLGLEGGEQECREALTWAERAIHVARDEAMVKKARTQVESLKHGSSLETCAQFRP